MYQGRRHSDSSHYSYNEDQSIWRQHMSASMTAEFAVRDMKTAE